MEWLVLKIVKKRKFILINILINILTSMVVSILGGVNVIEKKVAIVRPNKKISGNCEASQFYKF